MQGGCFSRRLLKPRRGEMVPHLVVPCAGDKLLRPREELYVLIPDGNPQVKPVIPYLVGVDRWGTGCGRLIGFSFSPSATSPKAHLVSDSVSGLSLPGPQPQPLPPLSLTFLALNTGSSDPCRSHTFKAFSFPPVATMWGCAGSWRILHTPGPTLSSRS